MMVNRQQRELEVVREQVKNRAQVSKGGDLAGSSININNIYIKINTYIYNVVAK